MNRLPSWPLFEGNVQEHPLDGLHISSNSTSGELLAAIIAIASIQQRRGMSLIDEDSIIRILESRGILIREGISGREEQVKLRTLSIKHSSSVPLNTLINDCGKEGLNLGPTYIKLLQFFRRYLGNSEDLTFDDIANLTLDQILDIPGMDEEKLRRLAYLFEALVIGGHPLVVYMNRYSSEG
jgi:hypothetical protein